MILLGCVGVSIATARSPLKRSLEVALLLLLPDRDPFRPDGSKADVKRPKHCGEFALRQPMRRLVLFRTAPLHSIAVIQFQQASDEALC